MSRYHANVIWQSADGTWARGFHPAVSWPDDPDDEGGVEFDHSSFEWVSAGHATKDEASAAWDGVNPGYADVWPYRADDPASARACLNFDVMAVGLESRERQRLVELHRSTGRSHGPYGFRSAYDSQYNGPSKAGQPDVQRRQLEQLGERYANLMSQREYYRLGNYANIVADPDALVLHRARLRQDLLDRGVLTGPQARAMDIVMLTDLHQRLNKLVEDTTRTRDGYYPRYGRPVPPSLEPTIALRDQVTADLEKAKRSRPRAMKPVTNASGAQGRVAAGVPSGGQFAATTRGRSGVHL